MKLKLVSDYRFSLRPHCRCNLGFWARVADGGFWRLVEL